MKKIGYSPEWNFIDFYLHEVVLVGAIILIFALFGLLFSRLLTMKSRIQWKRLTRENRKLISEYREIQKGS